MLIVTLVFTAFGMFSDVGVRNAIIVKKGTIEEGYLDTAWTMLVVRGWLLCGLGLLLAQPISHFYEEPILAGLVVLASFAPAIQGWASPEPILYEKRVALARVVTWGLISQTASTAFILVALAIKPSIWILAANGVVAASVSVALSYWMFRGHSPRLRWSQPVVREIFGFGKWVILGTALTFLARQGDALIVSTYLTASQLGVFSIAMSFAKLVELLIEKLSWSLLFPIYSELRNHEVSRLYSQLTRIKLILWAICLPFILMFGVFGREFVSFLYDPRYHEAGWMLELLALGSVFFAVGGAIINIPLSFGDSKRHMWLQFFRFVSLIGCLFVGASQAGIVGLLVGIVVAQVAFYPILMAATHKFGIRGYGSDITFMVLMSAVLVMVWSIKGWPLPAS